MKNNYSPQKNYFEKAAWKNNNFVCGIDEVGRGCLAGPLVVAAAIIPRNTRYPLLKDSKILTIQERLTAANWIRKNCWYAIQSVNHHIIDKKNIYQATRYAMKKAFLQLYRSVHNKLTIDCVVVDAMPLDLSFLSTDLKVHSFPFAESISASVAAASIIAKVTRDNLMKKIHHFFPSYNLEKHKGYGTQIHRNVLLAQGPSIIHRATFIKKIMQEKTNDDTTQTKLF